MDFNFKEYIRIPTEPILACKNISNDDIIHNGLFIPKNCYLIKKKDNTFEVESDLIFEALYIEKDSDNA